VRFEAFMINADAGAQCRAKRKRLVTVVVDCSGYLHVWALYPSFAYSQAPVSSDEWYISYAFITDLLLCHPMRSLYV